MQGALFLSPSLSHFAGFGTTNGAFELAIFVLWPLAFPVSQALSAGGSTALGAFLFGLVTNVILYGSIGERIHEEIVWRQLER